MICVVALIVFGILGIFSAKHRIIAKEAAECVFRRVTLRKCETGLDKRLKAQITGKLMSKHPKTGRFLYKYFEVFSWIMIILFVWSIYATAMAGYNLYMYENCNGEGSTAFCPFNPGATGAQGHSTLGEETELIPSIVTADDDPSFGNPNAETEIIVFGCFKCPYTKEAALTVIKKLYDEYQDEVHFVYRDFPLTAHEYSKETVLSANCVNIIRPDKYWDYFFKLFEFQSTTNNETMREIVSAMGVNLDQYDTCMDEKWPLEEMNKDFEDGVAAGVYGTPTFFINNEETIVGPSSWRKFKRSLK